MVGVGNGGPPDANLPQFSDGQQLGLNETSAMGSSNGSSGRPNSMKLRSTSRPSSMYPRLSNLSHTLDEFRSAPQSPQHNSVNSITDGNTTSEISLYQSALDLNDARLSMLMVDEQPLRKHNSNTLLVDDMLETSFMPPATSKAPPAVMYFRDGVRRIDFVLTFVEDETESAKNSDARRTFEANLKNEGLQLECEIEPGRKVNFVKIHAPWEILTRYAEIMKLKMPIKKLESLHCLQSPDLDNPIGLAVELSNLAVFPTLSREELRNEANVPPSYEKTGLFERLFRFCSVDQTLFPPKAKSITTEFSRSKEFIFKIPTNRDDFFSTSERSRIVDFILKRKRYSTNPNSLFAFGITRLLADEVYTAAYPLHEGCGDSLSGEGDTRSLLRQEWGSLRKIHKKQPIDYIKNYFGVMVGMYFAWLGFYTYMLIPASIVGLICFLYGVATIFDDQPSIDTCNKNLSIIMCPVCDNCKFWRLDETCIHSRLAHLVDNPAMVVFAVFMSFWGAVFLEMWKRYSATITYYWDLTGFDQSEEHPRPEYLVRLTNSSKRRMNTITRTMEPYISFWKRRFPVFIMSVSIVFLLTSVAIIALIGVIFYRMSVSVALVLQYDAQSESNLINRNTPIITTATAAIINLICIIILNQIYSRIAEYLTELEMPRTQTDYDDSLTLKMFLLQFVNYYASIFYIAFFKGKFVGYPGKYRRMFGYRQEECGPGGCLMELTVQLAIIMVGKQALNAVVEMGLPLIKRWLNAFRNKFNPIPSSEKAVPRWERDFQLVDMGSQGLFWEYLEMVLQFGFVTIFVAAFPLAPFFALFNNSIEMRLDAKKFLDIYRRPVSRRIKSIGVWYRIMDCLGKLSIVTNAFIIAFTSNFIPRLVYKYAVSPDGSLDGYLNYSLSYFKVADYDPESYLNASQVNKTVTECRYEDYRNPPTSENEYQLTPYFWYLLVVRLAFVVVFENVVMLSVTLLKWLVPDIPKRVQEKLRHDIYLMNEIIVEQEFLRARYLVETEKRTVRHVSTTTEDDYETPDSDCVRKRKGESMV